MGSVDLPWEEADTWMEEGNGGVSNVCLAYPVGSADAM